MTGIRAFISLAAILALLCLLLGGKVCGIRKDFTVLVNSSPIFCLFDTLTVLFQLFHHGIRKGPRSAIRFVASSRDQYPPPPNIDSSAIATASFQIFFLTQTPGMPWTQLITACYMSSYWTNYILHKLGNPELRPEPSNEKSEAQRTVGDSAMLRPVLVLATLGQVALWTIALKGLLPNNLNTVFGEDFAPALYVASFAVIVCPLMFLFVCITMLAGCFDLAAILAPTAIMVYLCSIPPLPGWPSIIEITVSALDIATTTATVAIGIIFALVVQVLHYQLYPFYFTSYYFDNLVEPTLNRVDFSSLVETGIPYGLILVFISIAAGLTYLVARVLLFGKLADKLHLRHRSIASNEGWACMFMFAMNITSAWLYYTKVYGPANV